MTKKRLFVVSGAVLVAAAAITTGMIFTTRANPEDVFFSAVSDPGFGSVGAEESTNDDNSKYSGKGVMKKDGSIRMAGTIECKSPTMYGDLDLKIGLTQVDKESFMKFNAISVANGDDADVTKQLNDFFTETIVGKSIQIDDNDIDAQSLKKYGTAFSVTGVTSTKISSDKISEQLRKFNVMNIVDMQDTKVDGKAATEYSIVVRRSAYEKFIDALIPKYEFKNDVIDNMFDNDTEEVSLTIDKKTGAIVESSYTMENLCAVFVSQFDPTASSEFTKTLRIKGTASNDKDVKEAVRPSEFLTQEQFSALLNGEGEE